MYTEDETIVITLSNGTVDKISCQSGNPGNFIVIDHDLPDPKPVLQTNILYADELPNEDFKKLEDCNSLNTYDLTREDDR